MLREANEAQLQGRDWEWGWEFQCRKNLLEKKIASLEDRLRDYDANRPSASMQFSPGDSRLFHVLKEEEIQTSAFKRLIYAEKQVLDKIRSIEEERRRTQAAENARYAREKQAKETEAARKYALACDRAIQEQFETSVQKAMANILANM